MFRKYTMAAEKGGAIISFHGSQKIQKENKEVLESHNALQSLSDSDIISPSMRPMLQKVLHFS